MVPFDVLLDCANCVLSVASFLEIVGALQIFEDVHDVCFVVRVGVVARIAFHRKIGSFFAHAVLGVFALVGGELPRRFLVDVVHEWHAAIGIELHNGIVKDEKCIAHEVGTAFRGTKAPHAKIGVERVRLPGHGIYDGISAVFPKFVDCIASNVIVGCVLGFHDEGVDVDGVGLGVVLHERLLFECFANIKFRYVKS